VYRSDRWLEAKLREVLGGTNTEALVHWIRAAREQPPVLFVGAGLSRTAKAKLGSPGKEMLSWAGLTRLLREDLGQDASGDEFLWVAEKFRCLFGPFALHSKLLEAVPDADMEPSIEHMSLRQVNWHAILTLNYDTLLERAFHGMGARTIASVISEEQAVRITARSSLPIIHLHGHIDHPSTIVLTLEDYRKYPEKHAIFLTIARQLLLQHPVLFLGFGANDPNFVAWSGWIRDKLGEQSPPWVRLQRAEASAPDAGMDAYWSPRLKTVVYPESTFGELLEVLGNAVEPLADDADVFVRYVNELVELTLGVSKADNGFFLAVIREVERVVQEKYPGPLDFIASSRRVDTVVRLLHAGLSRAGMGPDEIARLTERSREHVNRWLAAGAAPQLVSKIPLDQLPSIDEQKARVRSALAESFLPWLISAVRLAGRFIPLSEQGETRFDALEEYVRLRGAGSSPRKEAPDLVDLGLLTLSYELERLGASAREPAALTWLSVASRDFVDPGALHALDDLLHRHLLRWGDLPDLEKEAAADNAQGARLSGYLLAMKGGLLEAADAYDRAATLSLSEQEPLAVRYMTVRSARELLYSGMFGASDPQALSERRATADARLRALEKEALELQLDIALADVDDAHDKARRLTEEVAALRVDEPGRTVLSSRSEPLEPVLEFYERYWFSPTIVAATAARVAAARWDAGDKVSAAALLARFAHDDELAARARTDVEAPRPVPLSQDLANELLRAPRWPHERRARIMGLAEIVAELPAKARGEVLELALESYKALCDQQRLLTRSHGFPAVPAAALGLSVARYAPWPIFREWFVRLRELAGADLSQLGDTNWLRVPLHSWVRSGALDGAEADEFFDFLLQIARDPRSTVLEAQVFDAMTGLVLHHNLRLPPDGPSASALRAWISDTTIEDNGDAWVRSEGASAAAVLAGDDGERVRRECASTLGHLVDTAVLAGRWPSPFVVLAWLGRKDSMTGDDAAMARRLLATQDPQPSGALESAHKNMGRRMIARARMLIVAKLTPESEIERSAWAALIRQVGVALPAALPEVLERPLGQLDTTLRDALLDAVSNAFAPPLGHREKTAYHNSALSCLSVSARHSRLEDVPVSWLLSAATLTTAAHPRLAAYACTVLRNCLTRFAGEWTIEHASVLAELRRAVLRATTDGRASVVAAARRTLLDVAHSENTFVREHFCAHHDTLQRLADLGSDGRLAVVAAGEH